MARPTLRRHRKFLRLVHTLGIPEAHVFGHLSLMWEACYEAGEDVLGDALEVELAAGWRAAGGSEGVFAAAVVECNFVDLDNGEHVVHDLWDHAPDYVVKRAKREAERRQKGETISALRAAAAEERWKRERERKEMQTDANGGQLQPLAMQTDANGATPAPAPAPAPALSNPGATSSAPGVEGKPKRSGGPRPAPDWPPRLLAAIPDLPERWADLTKARGRKRPTETAELKQLQALEAAVGSHGVAEAVAMIERATVGGWQTIGEPRNGGGRQRKPDDDPYNIFRQTDEDREVIRRRIEAAELAEAEKARIQ